MKYLMWLLKAAIFFTLFAFALNNQHVVAVYFFFGTVWKAPLVLAILAAFTCGLALGVLVMMPRWWKKRKISQRQLAASEALAKAANNAATQTDIVKIPRHGL
ncbi:MAG: LapA family protein [Pseudomonadota bacterium]